MSWFIFWHGTTPKKQNPTRKMPDSCCGWGSQCQQRGWTSVWFHARKGTEIPYLRLRSHQELWSRPWHGWFLEQSFLVQNLFYNDIFVDVFFEVRTARERCRDLFVEYKHVCTKWSFAVSSLCLAHHAVCLWCSPRRWSRGTTNPMQIHWNCATFPSLIPGKMAVFDKTESLR